jgi:hypothetical protein
MKPKVILYSKGPILSLNPTFHPLRTNFEWKYTKALAELDIILPKVARYCSMVPIGDDIF